MTTPRFRIAHIMILAAAVALAIAALRTGRVGPGSATLVALTFAGLLLLALKPRGVKAAMNATYLDDDARIAGLERALVAASPFEPVATIQARVQLMGLYKVRKRYHEAIAVGNMLLRAGGLTHAGESHVRLEMAVCYDHLGLSQKAEAERQAADDCLDDRPEGAFGWYIQGKIFDKRQKHAEAVEAYARALDEGGDPGFRVDVLCHMMLSAFHAGLQPRTAEYAELVIESPVASEERRVMAHRMAGVAYLNMGRLDDALRHREDAHALAVASKDPKKVADCLSSLAEIRLRAGEFDRAEALCREAERMDPKGAREAILMLALVRYYQGRQAEAIERLGEAARRGILPSSPLEKRARASLAKARAAFAAELGRLDEAEHDLKAAEDGMKGDPKLGLLWDATEVYVLARRGDHAGAVARAGPVLDRLGEFAADRHTQLDVLKPVGRALFEAGDYARARDCWERYLSLTHDPLGESIAARHLGDCLRRLGDPDGARAMYERAAATGIDSLDAREAATALRAG